MFEFQEFPKIARLKRQIVVSEKIDGTNACVIVSDDGLQIGAQSRSRLITPEDDNYGFARWVQENRDELLNVAEIPAGLDMASWERWHAYRKAIKKPIKEPSVEAAMRKLAAFGADQAAVVENSVAEGYQGLFAAKTQPQAKLAPALSASNPKARFDAEMNKVKSLRNTWGVPEFRDPELWETPSEYRLALDSARVAKFERPRVFKIMRYIKHDTTIRN